MKKVERWLEKIYKRRVTEEMDRIVLVVGDEGVGKSTFMLESAVLWKRITGQEVDVEELLDQIVWGERDEFRDALVDAPPRSCIPVMDAAHALYRREATHPDEIEAEKDLLDMRFNENLLLLGYQEWDDVPKILAKRRAKNGVYIPKRGLVRGFNRESLDKRWNSKNDSWPPADLTDTFPSLEGTELWSQYKRRDRERKRQRMGADEPDEGESPADKTDAFAVAEQINNDGLSSVVSVHGGHNKQYIDAELIELHYETSRRMAKKVKKLLDTDPDIDPTDVDLNS
jgi:energy-coupling factor transporter ATP-binding protein EcfA2